jgi:proteasome lid subunit RPN8/RPN11
MPMERAILWNPSLPGARPSGRAPYPIFFQQEAVIALQEHLKSSPTQAIFGFLIGDVYRDPETGVLYTVIDKTLKLNQAIYGDKTEVVVARLWDRMQEQLAKAAGSLLGWYHSHPGQGGYLTTHDVETHEKYFTDPWHVAILVAAEAGGVTGRFFRMTQNADWHKTPLPFYELLQPDSIKPDGKKRSYITWRNYKAFEAVVAAKPGSKPTPPKAAPPPPPPPPVEEEEGEEEVEEVEEVEEEVEEAPVRTRATEPAPADGGFRIMRSSADDIPVIRSSADDVAAPPRPEPPPPPAPPLPPPPPPPPPAARKSAPVFIPDEEPPPRRSSDELPWAVTPESVASIPPPPIEPPAPRRTPTHTFKLKLLDQEEEEKKPAPKKHRRKRRGPWLRRLAILLLLAGVGAGAYWYFALRNPGVPPPWAGLLERAKKLVSRVTTRTPPPPPPPARPPAPPPAPVASPFARYDRLSDSLSRAVRSFQDRAALFPGGGVDCGGLASGLASVEKLWISYNTERRARMATFDLRRVTQDQALYAAVDSVESRFERSECPRP